MEPAIEKDAETENIRSDKPFIKRQKPYVWDAHRGSPNNNKPSSGRIWYSLPLAIALVPAFGSRFFASSPQMASDVILLGLVGLYLHYLLRFPWEWYTSIHSRLNSLENIEEVATCPGDIIRRKEAERSLWRMELFALLSCFVCPIIGGWLLARIRTGLSGMSEGFITTLNIQLFVLTAELRPAKQIIRVIRHRTWRLQEDTRLSLSGHAEQIDKRLNELEARMLSLNCKPQDILVMNTTAGIRELITPDIDALQRAVRRYEKREALHISTTTAKIMELEQRIEELTLLLKMHRRPFLFDEALDLTKFVAGLPLRLGAMIFTMPIKLLRSLLLESQERNARVL